MSPLECKQEFPKIWSGDLAFDQTRQIFKLGLDIVKTNILIKFHQTRVANVASECKQEFPKIWPGDLVFDLTWPIFELGLEIAKTNILIKFHQNRVANLASTVLTRIF